MKKLDKNSMWLVVSVFEKIKKLQKTDMMEIYNEGLKYLPAEYKNIEQNQKDFSDEEEKRNQKIYNEFKYKLEPEKGNFFPDVFQFYIQHKERLKAFIQLEDKKRLEKLIKETIFEKHDPAKIELIINITERGTTNYTTDQIIQVFGSCILLADELKIDVSSYRNKILSYIPFSYSEHLEAILNLVKDPTENELADLLNIYSEERKDDLTRFGASRFIQACERYSISKGISVLKYFVENEQMSMHDRQSALHVIAVLGTNEEEYFKNIFKCYKEKNSDELDKLSEDANKYLIEKYENENAVEWRLQELINRAVPFKRQDGVHTISIHELELFKKKFAGPLLKLKNQKYEKKYLELLEKSFTIYNRGDKYYEYATYLWSIVIGYFNNLKDTKSYAHLKDLEKAILENRNKPGINWFIYQFQKLKEEYMRYIGKPLNISDCIKQYNSYKEKQYLNVATPDDLFELIKKIVNEDLKRWWHEEGGFKYIKEKYKDFNGKRKQTEKSIQKDLKLQFENSLLKTGFRKAEICIQRESELLDSKRTDFLIYYGFIGCILIEIKLYTNPECHAENQKAIKYKEKLKSYVKGTNSHFGLFIIFKTEDDPDEGIYIEELDNLKRLYKSEDNIYIIGL